MQAKISNNPFDKDNIPRKRKNTICKKEFTKKEVLRILKSFDDPALKIANKKELRVLFYIGAHTGMREKDGCLLKWENVDWEANSIIITPAKTRRFNTVTDTPIRPELKEQLLKALDWKSDEYVLPNVAKRYKHDCAEITYDVIKILTYNGFTCRIPGENAERERKRAISRYGFHSFRYSFITACTEKNMQPSIIRDMVGHLTLKQTLYYTRPTNEFRQQVVISPILYDENEGLDIRSRMIAKFQQFDDAELTELEEMSKEQMAQLFKDIKSKRRNNN
jgi:integrase